jgi:hypothetical protein
MVSNSVVDAIGRTITEESKEHEVKKIVVDSCIEVCKYVLQSSFVLPVLCSDSDVILWGDLSKLACEDRKFINEAIKSKCLVMLCSFYCQRFTNHFFANKDLLTIFC